MNSRIAPVVLVFMLLFLWGTVDDRVIAKISSMPKIVLPETEFEFDAVHEGEEVRHYFIVQNKGTAPLEIVDVKTD